MNDDPSPASASSQDSAANIWRRSVVVLATGCLVLLSSVSAVGPMVSPLALGTLAGVVLVGLVFLAKRWKSHWPLAGLGLAGVVPLAASTTPFVEREFFFHAQYLGAAMLSASAVALVYAKATR
jgi:hypothetical protein